MIPMLLMVSQPFLITWEKHTRVRISHQWKKVPFFKKNQKKQHHMCEPVNPFIYVTAQENILWLGLVKQHRGIPLVLFRSLPPGFILSTIHTDWTQSCVIYLEPIVNSSLRLNENLERTLQSCAIARQYTRLSSHSEQQLAAGRAAGGGEVAMRDGGSGKKGCYTRTACVKPFVAHARQLLCILFTKTLR